MTDTATRMERALAAMTGAFNPTPIQNQQQDRTEANRAALRQVFGNTTFIYGTTGPNYIKGQNCQAGGGSCGVAKAVFRFKANVIRKRAVRRNGNNNLPPAVEARTQALLRDAADDMYDAGPRMVRLAEHGYQMMDMYYGKPNNNNNHLWRRRNNCIAEFLHYAMDFHHAHAATGRRHWTNPRHGRWDTPELAFDPNMPGWRAFQLAFPGANQPGYYDQPSTTGAYGQSATKEMSKIIRECIKLYGGTLIFEVKGVFGHNLFGPETTRHLTDTDVELDDVLRSVGRLTDQPRVPFGQGTVEFQWGGRPQAPTRAHFLINWNFSGTAINTNANRVGEPGATYDWQDYLENAFSDNYMHGLSDNWEKLPHFPANFNANLSRANKDYAIRALARCLSAPRVG